MIVVLFLTFYKVLIGDDMKLNNNGFTLVEVLAVLVILSIIVGLALPSFSSSLEKNEVSQLDDKKDRIISAAEMYITDYKYEIYNNLENDNGCYIKIDTLQSYGYLFNESTDSIDDKYVNFTKPNTYEITNNITGYNECNNVFIEEDNNNNDNDSNDGSTDVTVKYVEEVSTIEETANLSKSMANVYESYEFDETTGIFNLTGTNLFVYMLSESEFVSLGGQITRGNMKYVCSNFYNSSCEEIYELKRIDYNSGGTSSTLTYIKHNSKEISS